MGVPAPGEPAPETAPGVTRAIGAAPINGVKPGLVAAVAGAPDRVGGIGVHGGGLLDPRPARLLIRVPVLQDAPALRAQAWPAVDARPVAGRAAAACPVALGGLPPPALDRGLCEDHVLVDAPFTGRPAQDLLRRALKVAVDSRGDPTIGLRLVPGEEMFPDPVPDRAVERPVHALVLRHPPGQHPLRAPRTCG